MSENKKFKQPNRVALIINTFYAEGSDPKEIYPNTNGLDPEEEKAIARVGFLVTQVRQLRRKVSNQRRELKRKSIAEQARLFLVAYVDGSLRKLGNSAVAFEAARNLCEKYGYEVKKPEPEKKAAE